MPRRTPILLLTRPRNDSTAFAGEIGAVETIISPLIEIVLAPATAPVPAPQGLILTSAHAVGAIAPLNLRPLPAWCVGTRTADAAAEAGFLPQSATGDAEALLVVILNARPDGPLWHPHGRHVRGDIVGRLTAAGIACSGTEVYHQAAQSLSGAAITALGGDHPVIAPLFSPRTADLLARAGPFAAPLHVIAMSAAVVDAARPLNAREMSIADRPDREAMIKATRCAISFPGNA